VDLAFIFSAVRFVMTRRFDLKVSVDYALGISGVDFAANPAGMHGHEDPAEVWWHALESTTGHPVLSAIGAFGVTLCEAFQLLDRLSVWCVLCFHKKFKGNCYHCS
jgi:hypothetical protein